MIKGNALIGQSGGPTSVINSSLAGVIETALSSSLIENIYGMHFGIEGLMQEWLYDLGKQPRKIIEGLRHTPSSALGSSRHKVLEKELPITLDVLKKYNIRYFFLMEEMIQWTRFRVLKHIAGMKNMNLQVLEFQKRLIMIFSGLTIPPVLLLLQGQIS